MIFLSYSHKDKAIVMPMAEAFHKTFGEDKVFFDQWSIQPGDSLIDRMGEGLANCRYFFFLVSKSSLSSQMVGVEWKNALFKHIKGDTLFVPVKIDDCAIPVILLQNLYINLYGNGMEFAVRQMVDVASGRNTYRADEVTGFQNVRAYATGTNHEIAIEFRAEAYAEPHSKYMVLLDNEESEVSCSYGGAAGMFMMGFQKNVSLNNGETWNAFQISRSEATSPGFPFVVKLSASNDARISLKYTMRAVTIDSFKAVPLISNLQNTTKEISPN
ncbi:MAG: toll-Interleukin receptor [Parachlamydia sp.]|nr:MAG: toll-Interleukin receptor [Parachlamydia sp.]